MYHTYRVSKQILCTVCRAAMKELHIHFSQFLHSRILHGQAPTYKTLYPNGLIHNLHICSMSFLILVLHSSLLLNGLCHIASCILPNLSNLVFSLPNSTDFESLEKEYTLEILLFLISQLFLELLKSFT